MMTRKALSVSFGMLMIIAGVYCFFTPVETSAVIPFVLGIVMIGEGIGRIVTWFDIRDFVRQSAWVLVNSQKKYAGTAIWRSGSATVSSTICRPKRQKNRKPHAYPIQQHLEAINTI